MFFGGSIAVPIVLSSHRVPLASTPKITAKRAIKYLKTLLGTILRGFSIPDPWLFQNVRFWKSNLGFIGKIGKKADFTNA
jgi:hypothetical protein